MESMVVLPSIPKRMRPIRRRRRKIWYTERRRRPEHVPSRSAWVIAPKHPTRVRMNKRPPMAQAYIEGLWNVSASKS